jgi:mannose-6-phosphate isomerase-like protein (cupin superfamily)
MGGKAKPEIYTGERCYITEIVNEPAWPEFSIARCRVEPGATTQLHTVTVHEIYVIERGSGRMHLGNTPSFDVRAGDTVTIPKNVTQSISNTGSEDLVFCCVCAPKFSQDCYTSLE